MTLGQPKAAFINCCGVGNGAAKSRRTHSQRLDWRDGSDRE